MPAELENLLDRCLTERAGGKPIEVCLTEVTPEARRELEPLMLLVDDLRETPRPALSAAASIFHERRVLARVAQLRADQQRETEQPAPRSAFPGWRSGLRLGFAPAATILLLVASLALFAAAGPMVASARSDDTLYNVKLSLEHARILLSANDARRARVFVDIAQSRVAEIEALAAEGRPIPEELILQIKAYVDEAITLSASLSSRDAIPMLRTITELLSYERMLLLQVVSASAARDQPVVEQALVGLEASQQAVTQALQERVEEQVSVTPPSTAAGSAGGPVTEPAEHGPTTLAPTEISSTSSPLSRASGIPANQPLADDLGGASASEQDAGNGLGVGLQMLREGKQASNGRDERGDQADVGTPKQLEKADRQENGVGQGGRDAGPRSSKPADAGEPPRTKDTPAQTKQPNVTQQDGGRAGPSKPSIDSSERGRAEGSANPQSSRGSDRRQNNASNGESGGGSSSSPSGNHAPNQPPGKPSVQPKLR
jgi:hypothetical protein